MLACSKLNFFYDGAQRLKNVSFRANASSSIALFGHNGAGKSTLLKMLSGMLPIRSGEVFFNGDVALDAQGFMRNDLREHFGILFQGTSSDEKLSAFHNLIYAARLMGIPSRKCHDVVNDTLVFANLQDRAHEPLKKLSGGMRRRLELYRTFMHRPKLLFLDEPTSGLDVLEAKKFFRFLDNYCRETNAAIIMATHRPEEAINADVVLMMKEGEIIKNGAPQDLIAKLDYVRCSLKFDNETDFDLPSIFAVEREGEMLRAKCFSHELDSLLKNHILHNNAITSFSVDKPDLADVYRDLCGPVGAQ